jgi:tetratricopeptide (TPR) repeat protein
LICAPPTSSAIISERDPGIGGTPRLKTASGSCGRWSIAVENAQCNWQTNIVEVEKMKRLLGAVFVVAAVCAAPARANAACSVNKLADLPVTMASGYRPMVAAQINGLEARFIADSGAFYSLISPGMAKAAGLRLHDAPAGFQLAGIGGETNASVATVENLVLAGITIPKIEFLVGGTDTGTAGLLGQNVLGLGDVEYDFPHGMIRLFRSRDCGKTLLAYWVQNGEAYSMMKIVPLKEARFHTVGTVYVNGQALRATFDTGAGRTALSRRAAERVGVRPGDAGVVASGPSGGLGSKLVQGWVAPFRSIKVGDEEIRNVRLRIEDLDFGDSDMLVGADFFISHRVYVDNSANRMFFSYTGGNVFDSSARREGEAAAAAPAAAEAGEPADAGAFSRRGAVFMAQRDYARAIADFSRAIELAPKEPAYLLQRADAYLRSRRTSLGAADLNRAVEIDPSNVSARIERAQLRTFIAEREGALADLDAAARAAIGPVNDRLRIASGYTALDAYDRAIAQFDTWIAAHPQDAELPVALNGRCWARALQGQDLGKALADCNAALKQRPRNPSYLDSRGTVRLRMGDYDRAIADFDEALKINPKLAWSLYGRGVARRHKGLAAEAEADLKAAREVSPDIAERASKAHIE